MSEEPFIRSSLHLEDFVFGTSSQATVGVVFQFRGDITHVLATYVEAIVISPGNTSLSRSVPSSKLIDTTYAELIKAITTIVILSTCAANFWICLKSKLN